MLDDADEHDVRDLLGPERVQRRRELREPDQPLPDGRRRGERQPDECLLGGDAVLRQRGRRPLPVDVRRLVRRHRSVPGERVQRLPQRRPRPRLSHGSAAAGRDPARPHADGLARRNGDDVLPHDAQQRRLLLRRLEPGVHDERLLRLPQRLRRREQRAGALRERAVRRDHQRLLIRILPQRRRRRRDHQHDQPRAQRDNHRSLGRCLAERHRRRERRPVRLGLRNSAGRNGGRRVQPSDQRRPLLAPAGVQQRRERLPPALHADGGAKHRRATGAERSGRTGPGPLD